MSEMDETRDTPPSKPGLWAIVKSVLASFFGVQSQKNRERDFNAGKPLHFIIVAAVMTLVFLLVMAGVVTLILKSAGV